MAAPENLVDAVSRLRPTAILLLDTNTIMDTPRLESYEVAAPEPFLLVVPIVVYQELMSKKLGHRDQQGSRKASQALNVIDDLYARGNAKQGIDLGGDRRLISVQSPKGDESVEIGQVRRNLGKVDATLLRLSIACGQDCPDTPTLLVTSDKNLARSANAFGLTVSRLRDLRSSVELNKMLLTVRPSHAPVGLDALFDWDEERTVKVAMTLEEISSDGDYLISRGSGELCDNEETYPFHWTFPYRDLSRYTDLNMDIHQVDENVMPPDNLVFTSRAERITESMKNHVCRILEDSAGWSAHSWGLQSPKSLVRFSLAFEMAMEARLGWFYRGGGRASEVYELEPAARERWSPEEAERYDRANKEHDRLMESLLDGTAQDMASVYCSAFELRQQLDELLDWEYEYDNDLLGRGPFDLDFALTCLLDCALSTWPIGAEREEEFPFTPFAWPDYEQEAIADEEDADH